MLKHKILGYALLLVAGMPPAGAQVLSLDSILSSIRESNPVVKMYEYEVRSMDEAAKGARSWMAPELSTGLWMVPYNPQLWKKDDMGNTGMGQYMIGAQQMIPSKKKQDAEEAYMKAMSASEKEKKNASLNDLYAMARKDYYEWMIIEKKLAVIDQNEKLLDFMIRNAELRYRNGLEKISAYYKAKAAMGGLENMKLMMENEVKQKRIELNTLMSRDRTGYFDIDTVYSVRDYSQYAFDTTTFYSRRSDLKSIDREIQLALLKQNAESAKLKPEFGVRYEHMFGFGGLPMQYTLMGMMRVPMAGWSNKMGKANVESLKWKAEALNQQKKMMANEYSGMAYGMQAEMEMKKKQIAMFENNIIPALKRNYQSMQLGYEQNTEELFMLYDAWETLNMTQLEYLEQLRQLLLLQVELEKILELN